MINKKTGVGILLFLFFTLFPGKVLAASQGVKISFPDGGLSSSIDIFMLITMLSFLPALVIAMTCYVQIIIVLSLTRQALGTTTAPPNLVLSGMALILTLFIMQPVINDVNEVAYQPYKEGKIEFTEALERAEKPIKMFMVNNSKEDHIQMYAKIAGVEDQISKREDVPFLVASAASVTSQIEKALGIGAVLMLSFIVIDMVVATVLMLLGMFMLPPQMISLPIKIVTFLAAGGFNFVIETLLKNIVV